MKKKLNIGTKVKIKSPIISSVRGTGKIAEIKQDNDGFKLYRLDNIKNGVSIEYITEPNGQIWVNDFEVKKDNG
jgi:hypothetical protein